MTSKSKIKIPRNLSHPVKHGPEGGLKQHSRSGDRALLANRQIQTGDRGGHFQVYDGGKRRYLLD